LDELTGLVARAGFLPHGYCFQWSPGLLWSMVGSDLATALAYFSLPFIITRHAPRAAAPALNLGRLATLFAVFIFACGITHVLDVWTIWRPDYELQALGKTVTALASVLTAIVAWRLSPQLLALPSVEQMRQANEALRREIDRLASAEDHLLETEQSPGQHAGVHRCRLHHHRRPRLRHAPQRGGRAPDGLARGRSPGAAVGGSVRVRGPAARLGRPQPGGPGSRARGRRRAAAAGGVPVARG
jgi:hypothetical protein